MLLANQIIGFCETSCLKKEVNDEVYFWHSEKHRSFVEVDNMILDVLSQAYPKHLKQVRISF